MKRVTHQSACLPEPVIGVQHQFAGIVTAPLIDNEIIREMAPSGASIVEEAAQFILPSPTLHPHQRLQIYNQQYWWRLLNTLHANFPLVTRLFGIRSFNEKLGVPYLLKYPPFHWSLNRLGERFPKWVEESYTGKDKAFILACTTLDWAFMASFVVEGEPLPDLDRLLKEEPSLALSSVFRLQPHVSLFQFDGDLLAFRERLLKRDFDEWLEDGVPEFKKGDPHFFVHFRTPCNHMAWRKIGEAEFLWLQLFKEGSTLEKACSFAEEKGGSFFEEVSKNLQTWLQSWIQAGWLTLKI